MMIKVLYNNKFPIFGILSLLEFAPLLAGISTIFI